MIAMIASALAETRRFRLLPREDMPPLDQLDPTEEPETLIDSFASRDLKMAEFSVRHQSSIDKQGAPDAGSQSQQEYRAPYIACGAIVQFGETGGIGIVDGGHGPL